MDKQLRSIALLLPLLLCGAQMPIMPGVFNPAKPSAPSGPTYVPNSVGSSVGTAFNGATAGVSGTSGQVVVVMVFANNYGELTGGITDGLSTSYTRQCTAGSTENGNPLMYLYTGPLTSSGTVTVALHGTDTPMETVVALYSNVNTATPINVTCASVITSGSSSVTIPSSGSMTTSASTTLLTCFGAASSGGASTIVTSGYANRGYFGTSNRYIDFGDKNGQAAGNYTVTWTPILSSGGQTGMLIALQS